MTGFARIGGVNMRRALTCGHSAVMTTDTALGADGAVIKTQYYPSLDVMTNLTGFGGRHMQCALTRSNYTVVTTRAGAKHFVMIHRADERNPTARGGMTGVAIIRGTNVSAGFSNAHYAIMTANASANDFVMIYRRGNHWNPRSCGQMAGFTIFCCIDMDGTLA